MSAMLRTSTSFPEWASDASSTSDGPPMHEEVFQISDKIHSLNHDLHGLAADMTGTSGNTGDHPAVKIMQAQMQRYVPVVFYLLSV